MAPGMKWLAAAAASCALVALLVLRGAHERVGAISADSPVIDASGTRVWEHPLVRRVWSLSDELNAARIVYHERAAFDSGYAALPDAPGLVVAVDDAPPPVRTARDSARVAARAAYYDSIRAAFDDSLAAQLAGARSRARVALVQARTEPDSSAPYYFYMVSDPARFFAGADERGGYCFATFPHAAVSIEQGQPLGPCRLWVRYGAPSRQVLAWLAASGHLLEFDSVRVGDGWWDDYYVGARGFMSEESANTPRRVLFGIRQYDERTDNVALAAQGCLAGREELCLEAAFDPDNWRYRRSEAESRALQYRARYAALETIGGFFGDIERSLGPERFERFWTGATEPEAELAAALGEPLDEWTHAWLVAQFGAEPTGPRLEPGTLLLSLLAVAALIGAALVTARRRAIA